IAMLFVLAMAMIAVPAMAVGTNLANMGSSGVDILGRDGIFETESGACQFPLGQSTNFDSVIVADDNAKAYGNYWMGAHPFGRQAIATNDLEIKKNQDSGDCTPCDTCDNACVKVNLEQIKVGSRSATAFGSAEALNKVKIVTNQV
ncbi:MAG TPA: hypothetical protein VN455_00290, partial [Methanotrichaceae archaeon]|nr:hypothetical protein [Methanotrichaceae archaeon]